MVVNVTTKLKIPEAEHFLAVVTSLSKERLLKVVRQKLSLTQLELFRQTCLGHLLDLKELSFSSNLLHKMLLHEMVTKGVEKEMWFLVGSSIVCFSHVEIRLVKGLTFGPYPSDTTGSTRLRDMYFGRQMSMELKDLQEAYKAIDCRLIDDLDISNSTFGGEYAGTILPEQVVSSHSPRTPMHARPITASEEAPQRDGPNYLPAGHDSFPKVSYMDCSPPPPSASVPGPSKGCSDISQKIRALRANFVVYTQRQEEMWLKHEDILCRQEEILHRQDETLTMLVKELGRQIGSDLAQDSQV
ncbi:Ulp1 protease family, C-terminal catalytic domain containing protein [Melia azedarach]|uniref:Ulp1 protease family, C-terminal catalytic domain containing protein n=1 Tax=Melia azedarach TaxID=155640 RepID=A0ACC1XG12_MELAZ|nr:Ulp1 protease family, C-terminal catalytic domain containing protein [Melia azedarach]